MKAKEYFKKFIEDDWDDADNDYVKAVLIMNMMFEEVSDIAKQRNAKTDRAFKSIFEEQNRKCNSFLKMGNEIGCFDIKDDEFKDFISEVYPKIGEKIGWV